MLDLPLLVVGASVVSCAARVHGVDGIVLIVFSGDWDRGGAGTGKD